MLPSRSSTKTRVFSRAPVFIQLGSSYGAYLLFSSSLFESTVSGGEESGGYWCCQHTFMRGRYFKFWINSELPETHSYFTWNPKSYSYLCLTALPTCLGFACNPCWAEHWSNWTSQQLTLRFSVLPEKDTSRPMLRGGFPTQKNRF